MRERPEILDSDTVRMARRYVEARAGRAADPDDSVWRWHILPSHVVALADVAEQLIAEVEALRAALDEAADDLEAWGDYAREYWKWNLHSDVAKYRALASGSDKS